MYQKVFVVLSLIFGCLAHAHAITPDELKNAEEGDFIVCSSAEVKQTYLWNQKNGDFYFSSLLIKDPRKINDFQTMGDYEDVASEPGDIFAFTFDNKTYSGDMAFKFSNQNIFLVLSILDDGGYTMQGTLVKDKAEHTIDCHDISLFD